MRDELKKQVKITYTYINVRKSPNVSSEILGKVYKDDIYTVIDVVITNKYEWVKIRLNDGMIGYIANPIGQNYLEKLYTEVVKENDNEESNANEEVKKDKIDDTLLGPSVDVQIIPPAENNPSIISPPIINIPIENPKDNTSAPPSNSNEKLTDNKDQNKVKKEQEILAETTRYNNRIKEIEAEYAPMYNKAMGEVDYYYELASLNGGMYYGTEQSYFSEKNKLNNDINKLIEDYSRCNNDYYCRGTSQAQRYLNDLDIANNKLDILMLKWDNTVKYNYALESVKAILETKKYQLSQEYNKYIKNIQLIEDKYK